MERRFTASPPDGSQSRIAWLLWMLGGLAFTSVLVQGVIFVDALIGIIASSWHGDGLDIAVSIIEALAVALVAWICAGFARRRLLMPPETWFAVAVTPAAMWLIAVQGALNGSYLLVYLAAVITTGLGAAWLLDRRDEASRRKEFERMRASV